MTGKPTSETTMRNSLIFFASFCILGGNARAAESSKPNVLYIVTDQQHAGMLSCAGNRWLQTPAMDSCRS